MVSANAEALNISGGTLISGITYSITGGRALGTEAGDIETNGAGGDTIVFTFSDAVDFSISNTIGTGANNFLTTNTAISNTFVADAGIWSTAITNTDVVDTINGTTLTLNTQATGIQAEDVWGTATVSGATTITWTVPNSANLESFNFTAVPEPSSTALLGLGGLALLARRRRA